MGDNRKAAQPEQVGAAVRVWIEPVAQAARRGADQQPTQGSALTGFDLLAESGEDAPNRPLERLQDDVAGEAVANDDISGALEQVAALRVPLEVEIGVLG